MNIEYATADEKAAVMHPATLDQLWLNEQLNRIAPQRGEIGDDADRMALEVLVFELRNQLQSVKLAVHDYHAALDRREHGGVAQSAAIGRIERALNLYWQQHDAPDPRWEPDAEVVHQAAEGLLWIADEAKVAITIERVPRTPLAMGNTDYQVSVWPKRGAQ